ELLAVDVPAQLLDVPGAVPLEAVGVEPGLAGLTGARAAAAQALGLVARAAGADVAVQHPVRLVLAVDVLHHVELADAGPVPVVPAVRRAQGPERRPVPERGVTG